MAQIILIRGFASSGTDNLGFGRFHLGPVMKPSEQELRRRGFEPIVLRGLGTGSIVEHVEKAVQSLRKIPAVVRGEPLHLVGHSMGGLIARSLAQVSGLNVAAVTTLATPHRGAFMAVLALEMRRLRPKLYKLWEVAGYKFKDKLKTFNDLSPEVQNEWNENHPDPADVDIASFQFSLSPSEFSPPIRALYYHIPAALRPQDFDGYVELKSQYWGQSLGHYPLDHMASNGWNFHILPSKRQQFRREYDRLLHDLEKRLRQF